jgi:hypothetical protein
MKTVTRLVLTAVLGFVLCVAELSAWGTDGHQIVARIAARKLTANTKRRIVALARPGAGDVPELAKSLGKAGDPQPSAAAFADAIARMAVWPDRMPGGKGATEPWHYTDFGLFEGPTTTADRCPDGCVTKLIPTLIGNIKASKRIMVGTTSFAVDKELRFLIHFLGDIHQPLHVSTDADAGGNCEKVTGFSGSTELHAVWDTALVSRIEKSTQEGTVTAILAEFHSDTLAGGVIDPAQIADESFALAKNDVYPNLKPTAMPVIDHFVDLRPSECKTKAPLDIRNANVDGPASFDNAATKALVRKQLFRAGVRLATVLNSLFM